MYLSKICSIKNSVCVCVCVCVWVSVCVCVCVCVCVVGKGRQMWVLGYHYWKICTQVHFSETVFRKHPIPLLKTYSTALPCFNSNMLAWNMISLHVTWGVMVISEALDAVGVCDIKYLFQILFQLLWGIRRCDRRSRVWLLCHLVCFLHFLDLHFWESVILKH